MRRELNHFSVYLALGITAGLAWVAWKSPEKRVLHNLDLGVWLLAGALVGSRAGYAAAAWSYFQSRPGEIPQFWLGGLSGAGALWGGALSLAALSLLAHQSLGELLDIYFPLAYTTAISAWLACWQAGVGYGGETGAWWGLPAINEWGEYARRAPVQFSGAMLSLLLFWLLEHSRGRATISRRRGPFIQPGFTGGLGLLALSLVVFGLSFWQADPSPTWRGIRPEAWGSLALAVVAAAWLGKILVDFYSYRQTSHECNPCYRSN